MDNGDLGGSSTWQAKLERAWVDWLRPLGVFIVAGIGYGAYHFNLIGERTAGVLLVAVVLIGVLLAGLLPALGMCRRSSDRTMIFVFAALALAGSAWPTLRVALSSKPLASARLTAQQSTTTLTTNSDGPYELVVAGHFKQAGAANAEASYTLKVTGQGSEEVSGSIKKEMHSFRTSRKGGTTQALLEQTEVVHRLQNVGGGSLSISTDGIDDTLDGGLDVSVRSAGPRPEIFWALGALAILFGLILDVRLVARADEDRTSRGKRELTYLTVVAGMLLVFSINFPQTATPSALVRTAIGAFVLSLIIGFGGGWILTAFVRLAAKPKRRV